MMRDHRWIMGVCQIAADTSDAANLIYFYFPSFISSVM